MSRSGRAASGEFGAPLQNIINADFYDDVFGVPAAIETHRIAAEIFGEAPASDPAAKA